MKKLLSTAIAFGLLTTLTPAAFALDANVLPKLNSATNGKVTTGSNNDMNVLVDGGQGTVGTFNWGSFNVGKDASVNFEFSAHNQTSLNIVDAAGGMSQIYGKLTNSGCQGCGYAGTGKVILLNPNGVMFGETANVNLNSFTASGFNGNYENNKLTLTKGEKAGDIVVKNGAQIYGDEAVNLVGKNVNIYNGSKISTNITKNNFNKDSMVMGKVKIATGDGVNFTYYNSGAVKNMDVTSSADKMIIQVNGDITSGNIDIRNGSTNADSQINLNGATLKAVKAEMGNDGNIWLTSGNKAIVGGSTLLAGGDIAIQANEKVTVASGYPNADSSYLTANGNISLESKNGDTVVDNSRLTAGEDITIKAAKIASVQKSSEKYGVALDAKNVTIDAGTDAQVVASTVNAKNDINIKGGNDVYVTGDSLLSANNNINVTAEKGKVQAKATMEAKNGATTITAATDIKGGINFKNTLAKMYANGGDINVKLAGVSNKQKGLTAEAKKNVNIETKETLSVSRLVAKEGDMTLTADKIVAGLPYTNEAKIPGDNSERSYIYVANGTFTANTANDKMEVTASDTDVYKDGQRYQQRHHIQFGNGEEKILLINNRLADEQSVDPVVPASSSLNTNINDDQAAMKNKLPAQPQTITVNNNITNNKTQLVDVFAAASQIEIEDDEDED